MNYASRYKNKIKPRKREHLLELFIMSTVSDILLIPVLNTRLILEYRSHHTRGSRACMANNIR